MRISLAAQHARSLSNGVELWGALICEWSKGVVVREGRLSRCFFEHSLFELFLALDAVAGPGDGFEALGIDLPPAGDALAEVAFADAGERTLDHLQELAVGVALVKEKFLVVGTGGLVGDILRRVFVCAAAILLRARDGAPQVLLPRFQLLAKEI